MKRLTDIQNIYFIGIGGIGMSALAFYFHNDGKRVVGYDKTSTAVTLRLQDAGVSIHFEDTGSSVGSVFANKEDTLVIFTPAVPQTMGELTFFRESGYTIKKRAEVLGMIANQSFSLAVAGTHGKTTTSSILGHLLAATGVPVTAFIGGITNNYKGNLIQKGTEVIVVEADEFDRSFLQLKPDILCITSMDADHLDVYETEEALVATFQEFGSLVAPGMRFVKNGLPLEGNTVGIEDTADYSAQNVRVEEGTYVFDFIYPEGNLKNMRFSLPGRHNLFNAVTALGMAVAYGSPLAGLEAALATYAGVHRRFTYRIQTADCVLIDDYAHHPTEVAAVHQSVREMYPGEEVLAIFQPHLFSRTQDFMTEFAEALSRFDEVVLLEIYPAREQPIAGVTSATLLKHLRQLPEDTVVARRAHLVKKEELTAIVRNAKQKVIVAMGAGDIGFEISKLIENLNREG